MKPVKVLLPLLTLVVFAAWFVLLRPTFVGGPTSYIIVSGHSMEPKYYTGDLVITHRQADYKVGNIVAYTIPAGDEGAGNNVIHRIIGGDGITGYKTQGINNSWVDDWHPKSADVIGKAWLHMSGKGGLVLKLRQPAYMAALFGGLASIGIAGDQTIEKTKRRRRGGVSMATQLGVRGRFRRTRRQVPGYLVAPASATSRLQLKAPFWSLVGLGVAGALAVAAALVAVPALTTSPSHTTSVTQTAYTQSLSFDYTFNVTPSLVYPLGKVGPVTAASQAPANAVTSPSASPAGAATSANAPAASPIYTALAQSIEVGFGYGLTGANATDVHGEISADLLVQPSGTSGWSNKSTLMAPTPFDGATANGRALIDLAPIQTTIDQIEKETNFRAGTYDITVVPHVSIAGVVDGQQVNETYSSPLTFTYDKTTITPATDLQASQPKAVVDRTTTPNHVNLLGMTIGVSRARLAAGMLALFAAAAAAIFGSVAFLGLGRGQAVQLLARSGVKVVPVEGVEQTALQRVRLSNLQDLAKMAQRDGRIIFSQAQDDNELLFVPDGAVTYEYVYQLDSTE
ncbi:MAG TPA: signal peptidase I [Dehalococcoidia bacterium]|nr:signal peptidase I [Dehalococcoidia bacterium]